MRELNPTRVRADLGSAKYTAEFADGPRSPRGSERGLWPARATSVRRAGGSRPRATGTAALRPGQATARRQAWGGGRSIRAIPRAAGARPLARAARCAMGVSGAKLSRSHTDGQTARGFQTVRTSKTALPDSSLPRCSRTRAARHAVSGGSHASSGSGGRLSVGARRRASARRASSGNTSAPLPSRRAPAPADRRIPAHCSLSVCCRRRAR